MEYYDGFTEYKLLSGDYKSKYEIKNYDELEDNYIELKSIIISLYDSLGGVKRGFLEPLIAKKEDELDVRFDRLIKVYEDTLGTKYEEDKDLDIDWDKERKEYDRTNTSTIYTLASVVHITYKKLEKDYKLR